MKDRITNDKKGQLVTGGCCQWQDSTSYDSDEVIETFVLRRKFSDEPPNSIPPTVTSKPEKKDSDMKIDLTTYKDRKKKQIGMTADHTS